MGVVVFPWGARWPQGKTRYGSRLEFLIDFRVEVREITEPVIDREFDVPRHKRGRRFEKSGTYEAVRRLPEMPRKFIL